MYYDQQLGGGRPHPSVTDLTRLGTRTGVTGDVPSRYRSTQPVRLLVFPRERRTDRRLDNVYTVSRLPVLHLSRTDLSFSRPVP